jgi:hypothetical protein
VTVTRSMTTIAAVIIVEEIAGLIALLSRLSLLKGVLSLVVCPPMRLSALSHL